MSLGRTTTIAWIVLSAVLVCPLYAQDFHPPKGVRVLLESEIRQAFVGNTAVGKGRGGQEWREYYAASGLLLGKTGDNQEYLTPNYWTITGSTICFDYKADEYDMCSIVGVDTSHRFHYLAPDSGKVQGEARVLPGKQLD